MLLIDDRTPPPREPSPERPVWEPNWPMWAWVVAAVALLVTGSVTGGLVSVLAMFACVGCTAQAAVRAIPYGADSLRGHRQ